MRQPEALAMLQTALDDPNARFRDGQWEAIDSLVNRLSRVLLVQRTGWGKSIVYFVATRGLRDRGRGPTLLISPLLSLMRNQIQAAGRLGLRAYRMASDNQDDWQQVKAEIDNDRVDILYISPERLGVEDFLEQVLLPIAASIGMFVVDEAHCLSDWGHEFRPDYRRIVRVLQALPPNLPVLATTATANDRVVNDLATQLGENLAVVRGPLARESLRLQNIQLPDRAARLAWLAERIPELPGSGIVYVLTRRDAETVADWLQSKGIAAWAYHAGLGNAERARLEEALLENKVKALVATVALGMGFDKPDLGFVIHYQRPGSVVFYYQQVGRAGRAVDNAWGVMLCGEEDEEINNYFIENAFSPLKHAGTVIEVVSAAGSDGLTARQVAYRAGIRDSEATQVLKFLAVESPAPISRVNGRWVANPVVWKPDRARIEAVTAQRQLEQEQMVEYMQTSSCLMEFLAKALNDPHAGPCGRCASCTGGGLPESYSEVLAAEATWFLEARPIVIEPREQWLTDALADRGWVGTIPLRLRYEPGRALCRWGDPGLAQQVKEGKAAGQFSDGLVEASARLILRSWRPAPMPAWVTAVPSLTHAELVPSFAQRLAARLGLKFVPCVRKTRHTRPQKEMRNSYQQVTNLAGAFTVERSLLRPGPVLLVDDMVDSRWTFTIVAAELREAGCEMVYPYALADTSQTNQ